MSHTTGPHLNTPTSLVVKVLGDVIDACDPDKSCWHIVLHRHLTSCRGEPPAGCCCSV